MHVPLMVIRGALSNEYQLNILEEDVLTRLGWTNEYTSVVGYSNTIARGQSGTGTSSAARSEIISTVNDAYQSMEESSEAD